MDHETPLPASDDLLGRPNADTERRYRVLLDIADTISSRHDLRQLLGQLVTPLRQLLEYDFVAAFLNEPGGITRLLSIESRLPTRLKYDGLEFPTSGTHVEAAFTSQQPIAVSDVELEPHVPQV